MEVFENEILKFKEALSNQSIKEGWTYLERAHVIGQFNWKKHFYVHILMIIYALRTKNIKEFMGQVPRLILTIPGSVLHKAPVGNVGTTRIGIFTTMPISDEIKKLIDKDKEI